MKVAGEAVLHAPVEAVWDALHDPGVLVRTIPGCERLETTGENAYDMTVTAGVAAIRGTYAGRCELQDVAPKEALLLKARGAGAAGTIAADVTVDLADHGDGTTRLRYDADAEVGGMIAGVGQRMLTSVSKRMAAEFFGKLDAAMAAPAPAEAAPEAAAEAALPEAAAAPRAGAAYVAPARPPAATPPDFVKGVLVGGGLVLLGVVAGALAGRRRG